MLTDLTIGTATGPTRGLTRRSMFRVALVATLPLSGHAWASTEAPDATATVAQFNAALLGAMKSAAQTGFTQRFQALAPAIDHAFDLPAVLSVSVGLGWASLTSDQQARLLEAFRRYTVASYVASFDSYNGQTFSIASTPRDLDGDRVIVQSRITPLNGNPVPLDYVMKQTSAGWKIVDVLAAGSISRVAVQRSDFRNLLSSGGGDALLASLQQKASDLSGGALA